MFKFFFIGLLIAIGKSKIFIGVILDLVLVVERVAKSRVSNSSGSKKSDSGRVGYSKIVKKVGFGYQKSRVIHSDTQKFALNLPKNQKKAGSGRVGYIPDLEKSG